MSVIDYQSPRKLLLSVKGHPYERDAFFDMFESIPGFTYSAVEQPLTEYLLAPEVATEFDCLVFYDMPGLDFQSRPPRFVDPSDAYKKNFLELLERGTGVVFLHHAIAAWPTWSEYSDIVGGRFLYLPGSLRGIEVLDSGYCHNVGYTASIRNHHPVTAGLPATFPLTDELYLYEVFEEDVIPLVASGYSFDAAHFNSASEAVSGEAVTGSWPHPPGSALVGWVKSYKNSPVVYLQMGDGSSVFADENYRRLLANAVQWVSSEEARTWARGRARQD